MSEEDEFGPVNLNGVEPDVFKVGSNDLLAAKPEPRLGSCAAGVSGCGICGSKQYWIRGRYPKDLKRLVCPTCLQERLEQINDISSSEYGKSCQSR